MSALDEIVELYEAQHSDGYVAKRFRSIEGPKLVAIARAAQDILGSLDVYVSTDSVLLSIKEQEGQRLKETLAALDTIPHRSDEIRREIDDLECKIDELERELECEIGYCEEFAID